MVQVTKLLGFCCIMFECISNAMASCRTLRTSETALVMIPHALMLSRCVCEGVWLCFCVSFCV